MQLPCDPTGGQNDHSRGCARSEAHGGCQVARFFLFADFCRGEIWGLKRLEKASTENAQSGWQSVLLANAGSPISSIGEDDEGNVYAAGYQNGTIYMITER